MLNAWRIDSLNARGGLAFVSWRGETLFSSTTLEEAPAFFIGSPSFTPQPVADRGVGIAAERYGFQLGLLDDEGEVAFDSLINAAEFIRRLYIISGRGDGTTDSGAPLPIPLPPDEPPLGGTASEIAPLVGLLGEDAVRFERISAGLKRGQVAEFTWQAAGNSKIAAGKGDLLLRGAEIVLVELLTRFPARPDPQTLERWRNAAQTYLFVVRRLGLVEEFYTEKKVQFCCEHFLTHSWSGIVESIQPLQGQAAVEVVFQLMADQQVDHFPWAYLNFPYMSSTTAEPMDDLIRMPIPGELARLIDAADLRTAGVFTLLSAALGAPQILKKHQDVEAVLLFAACRIVAVDGAEFIGRGSFFGNTSKWNQITADHRRSELLRAAHAWLAKNLANRVYDKNLEGMIADAAKDQLHNPDPSGTSNQGKPQPVVSSRTNFAVQVQQTTGNSHRNERTQSISQNYMK